MKSLAATKHVPPKLLRMEDVKERKMKWLWYPYFPLGAASLVFGPGGYGKSQLMVLIASHISTGTALPGQDYPHRPMNVLMMSAEDDIEAVLKGRLVRAGADLTRIFVPEKVFTLDKQGFADLEGYIVSAEVDLVIIDPVVRYIGGKVDMFRANEVRDFVGPIHEMAQKYEIAEILVGHSRKGGEGDDWEKAMGSVDFINAVRSVMFVTKTPDGDRVFRHVKTNYGMLGESLLYTLDDDGAHWNGVALDDVHDPKPEEPQQFGRSAAGRKDAGAFIRHMLADGPVSAKLVEQMALDEGINPRTLARAKRGLAESRMIRVDGKPVWEWYLKEGEPLQ